MASLPLFAKRPCAIPISVPQVTYLFWQRYIVVQRFVSLGAKVIRRVIYEKEM
jgi:hypothetical protein